MMRKGGEKLAFPRGFHEPGTIFEGFNWDSRCEGTIFTRKNRDSEILLVPESHI